VSADSPAGGRDGVIAVAVDHHFAVRLREGFDYITDSANWSEYWPGLVAIEPGSRWERVGDRASLSLRMMGRPTELVMTLGKLEPYRLVSYRSEQRGLPPAEHERHFSEAGNGFDYRLVVSYRPRRGLHGYFDRTIFRRAVKRALEETVENLERRFEERAR
jgi:Polyketide cyclase / dehydrase and lipid transport